MEFLETERLMLKLYSEKDKTGFLRLLTDKDVMKKVDTGVYPIEKAEALWIKLIEEFYPQGLTTIWAVFVKENHRYIGNASIRPRPEKKEDWEIGYILQKEEWGKGFATEIARKLIEFGFTELNLSEVFATVDTDNDASIHVLKKVGMKHLRDEYDEQGIFYLYGIRKV